MQDLFVEDDPRQRILAARLKYFSLTLFAAYLLTAIAEALPLKLADSGWQLNIVSILVDNAPLPLLGLALAHLAAHLVGTSAPIHQYRDRVATLAIIPAIGFFLLAPAQLGIGWNAYANANQAQIRQLDLADRRLELLGTNIGTATTFEQMQAALRAQQGTQLSGASLDQPLSSIKTLLQVRIHEARQVIRRSRSQLPPPQDPTPMIRRSLRVSLMSLVFAAAYAIAAQRPYSEVPLLLEWTLALLEWSLAGIEWLQSIGERIARLRERRRLQRDYRRNQASWAQEPLPLNPLVELQEQKRET
jgi:hypothetical protein